MAATEAVDIDGFLLGIRLVFHVALVVKVFLIIYDLLVSTSLYPLGRQSRRTLITTTTTHCQAESVDHGCSDSESTCQPPAYSVF